MFNTKKHWTETKDLGVLQLVCRGHQALTVANLPTVNLYKLLVCSYELCKEMNALEELLVCEQGSSESRKLPQSKTEK